MTSTRRLGELSHHVDLPEHADLSHHGDFDPEQAAMLQDLARNGAPEGDMYGGYSDAETTGAHMNGYGDGAPGEVQSNGLLHGQQDLDLDDPAALLESLANYEHPPSSSNAPISNDHFESLLQAAATAGGQEVAQEDSGRTRRSTRHTRLTEDVGDSPNHDSANARRPGVNKRVNVRELSTFVRKGNRHKRNLDETDEEEQLRREREIWGPEDPDEEAKSNYESQYGSPTAATSDARAAGVHSAAALFRRPSIASKKYTRPPMSKLFTSLELTPEQFLRLQAAAKTYMLNPDHPERRDCVGNRGRSDTDMVKLKLFGCVKSFLEDEDWGERCFGSEAEGAEARKLRWPQMKNKVISLVTPLLRRMVTNERQRQYAVVTRKSQTTVSTKAKAKTNKIETTPSGEPKQPLPKDKDPPSEYPDIDPKLDQYHYVINPAPAATTSSSTTSQPYAPGSRLQQVASDAPDPKESYPLSPLSETNIHYHVNVLHCNVRIRPKLTLSPSTCPGFSSLVQHVRGLLDRGENPTSVQVLGPEGLKHVDGEEEWLEAVKAVADQDWMDGEVRVVVEVAHGD